MTQSPAWLAGGADKLPTAQEELPEGRALRSTLTPGNPLKRETARCGASAISRLSANQSPHQLPVRFRHGLIG
jgi:hypothetical protein